MDHPNILGGVLSISLIFIAYFLAKKKMLNNRKDVISSILLFVFYFIDLFALFFTFSRSAWLALIIGLLTLLFVLIFKKDRLTLKRFIAVLFFSLILICINVAPYQDLLMARIDPQTRLEKKSIDERLAYINQASDLSKQHLISGVGVGNYGVVTAAADNNKKSAFDYQPVHNVFLLILAESGIFSLISFFTFLFFLIRNGRREVYAWAILMPLLVLMLLDHWLISLPYGVFFLFLLLGLI